ncbi:MAG: cysteine desulfurase family protein [Parvibaculum sp.]|uniref:cysteine desulfurase family protein n=1 Tax=Parvibaculum sp. TaxID=2024848 RepID=UPI003C74AC5D
MTIERAYMDHNATAPVRPEAAEAVARVLALTGNPSSVHAEGRAAHKIVEDARAAVAALVNAKPAEITFTSGGTEAANLALHAARNALGVRRIVLSSVEHDAVRLAAAHSGLEVEVLPVNESGVADLEALAGLLDAPGKVRTLVALMLANNETGVIQPVAEAAAMARAAGAFLLTDAIQAVGRMPVDFAALGVDMMLLSGHKLGSPQGVGALVWRDELAFEPLIRGGGQELRRRSGTENVPGIAGFGAAARAAARDADAYARIVELRDALEAALKAAVPEVRIFGENAPRLANTSLFSSAGLNAETLLMILDLDGFAVSAGSACSSGKVARSHVLEAMGVEPYLAKGAVRVSLGLANTRAEIERFVGSWARAAAKARAHQSDVKTGVQESASVRAAASSAVPA